MKTKDLTKFKTKQWQKAADKTVKRWQKILKSSDPWEEFCAELCPFCALANTLTIPCTDCVVAVVTNRWCHKHNSPISSFYDDHSTKTIQKILEKAKEIQQLIKNV